MVFEPQVVEEYKRYHCNASPEIMDMLHKCNIRNYSICLKDDLLFGYWEYTVLITADMARMAADPKTQEMVGNYGGNGSGRSRPAHRASDGPAWKKSFISTEGFLCSQHFQTLADHFTLS